MVKRIDVATVPTMSGCGYPPPFDRPCAGRTRRRLGDAAGLSDFGVNLLRLPPGAWSSQRHWHSAEDEGDYPDIDLRFLKGDGGYVHKDGTPYPRC